MKNLNKQIALFKGKGIRRIIYKKEWWFSVVDVVAALTDSPTPRKYWGKIKQREFIDPQLSPIWGQLKLESSDGKTYKTDCANTEGLFRIIQSIPSPKAEPFKRWLAKTGYERIQEIDNPELGSKRAKLLYKLKGYPDSWIEKRLQGIAVRNALTDEWDKRGADNQQSYEILTAEISKATFELTPSDYKKLKGLKKENLRDHMNSMELILTMLSEQTTKEIHKDKNSKGLPKLKDDARAGGQIAGSTRKQIERKLGRTVISKKNFLSDVNKKQLK
ncbi:MAG: Prophage antirepressor [Parcubacteria group bacterium GW2011_GWC2_39_14]|nr:MAG: Prophage antirepressor [Parcubacteria group bacterium GW2011_GWC2_39_14]KKR55048.1 MAG: Prophage antirepressor [Parcubacteria group bacterium GW2011_GWA2_40_23]